MTARKPSDPRGARLWELDNQLCGMGAAIDDLLTLAWGLYHDYVETEAGKGNPRRATPPPQDEP